MASADQTGINGNISADPMMANYQTGNFHLQTGSPCVDAGYSAAIEGGWTDIDGQARIIGSGVDIGADESDGTVSAAPTPIYYVKTGGNDAQNGLSWATAKKTWRLQSALHNIPVERFGWPPEPIPSETSCLLSCICTEDLPARKPARDQRNISANPTILDGGGGQPTVINSLYAGYFLSAIDGFTIQNGGLYTGGSIPTAIRDTTGEEPGFIAR